ncbi:hypothetical protein CHUAL_010865 [Chamberlinius hualienensis]
MGKKNRKKTTWRKLSLQDESSTDSSDVKDRNSYKHADADPCYGSSNPTARLHSMSAKKPFLSSRKYRQYPPYHAAEFSSGLTGQTTDDASSNVYSASDENACGDEQLYFQPFVYPCLLTPAFVVPPYHPSQWYEDPRIPYDSQHYICLTQPLSSQPPQSTSSIKSCSSPDNGSDVGYSSSSPPASNRTSEEAVQSEDSIVNYSDGVVDDSYAYSQQQPFYHQVAGMLPEDQQSSSSPYMYPGTTYVLKPVAILPRPPPTQQECWWDNDYGGGGVGRRRRRRGFIGGEGITYDRWPSRIAKDPQKSNVFEQEQRNITMQEDIGDERLGNEFNHNTEYFASPDHNLVASNDSEFSQNQLTFEASVESEYVQYANEESIMDSHSVDDNNLALIDTEENRLIEIGNEDNRLFEVDREDVQLDQVENEQRNCNLEESENTLTGQLVEDENVESKVIECGSSAVCEESAAQYELKIETVDKGVEEFSKNANEVSSTTNIEEAATEAHSFTPTDTWSSACRDPLRYSKYYQICGVEVIDEEEKVETQPEDFNEESIAQLEFMPCMDEIVVHEVDDCGNRSDALSECGSEDVEMIGHRYESGAEKLYKPSTVSLASELLSTNQQLPYDQNIKHLMERSKRVTLTTTTGYLSNTRHVMESYCNHLAIRHQTAGLGVGCDGNNGRPRSDGLDEDDIDVADVAEEEIIFRRSSTEANVFQPQAVTRGRNGLSLFYLSKKRSWHGCCCSVM